MVQPSDFRNGDDLAIWHDGPSIGGVLTQGQVRSGAMIVGKVALQQTTKMPPIQNYHMIQTFTTNRTISRSANAFCQGLRGAVTTSFMAKEWMRQRNALP